MQGVQVDWFILHEMELANQNVALCPAFGMSPIHVTRKWFGH
jgi:hypothetical protein